MADPATPGGHAGSNSVSSSAESIVAFDRAAESLSRTTLDRATSAKYRLEHFYKGVVTECADREARRVEMEQRLANENWSEEKKQRQLVALGRKESEFLRLRRVRLGVDDFNTLKVIGKGAFGEVRLVQKADTGKIYAMKTLRKAEMVKKDQLAHVKAERDVLAESVNTPWVVQLYYSFQDAMYLYLIMEFLPGGDLMTMLIKYDTFSEDVTRFYIAECVSAISAVHDLGFVHRDIKPDNLLIDKDGHIKLSDFGLSTGFHKTHDSAYYQRMLDNSNPSSKMDHIGTTKNIDITFSRKDRIATWKRNRRSLAYSTVGTPDYIAPEGMALVRDVKMMPVFEIVLKSLKRQSFPNADMEKSATVGYPPFCSESAHETYRKIINWREHLYIPDDVHLSREAEDMVRRLLCDKEHRMNAGDIRAHPFFRGVDWENLRRTRAPFVPQLKSITDTSYFPIEDLAGVPEQVLMTAGVPGGEPGPNGDLDTGNPSKDLAFVGYTFKRWETIRNDL
ncbi:Serine/threonine-protein kinase [Borealophlyctis nickersoniae]|nr:Serine/threonine-protein kinase [Borealophlyctis nickersoniae]